METNNLDHDIIEHEPVARTNQGAWQPLSAENLWPANSSNKKRPTPRSQTHLPTAHENRTDAIDSLEPVMRVSDLPLPRQRNPAHQHLITQESPAGARSKMYLLNQVARLFGARDYEHVAWADLKVATINSVLAILRDQGYKPSSRNAYLTVLKSTAREAWVLKQMDLDDYERIKLIKRFKQSTELSGSAHDFTILMDIVESIDNDLERPTRKRDALILLLMIFTGMRRKEIVQVKVPDHIFFEQKDIYITGKGNKYRFGRLPEPIWDRLVEYIFNERQQDPGFLFCPYWNKRSQPKSVDKGLDVSSVNRIIDRCVKHYAVTREANFPDEVFKITPHDIRRSFATIMEKEGLTLREIQILLDHANLSTTERYVHDNKEGYRGKAAGVGNKLLEKRTNKQQDA